MELELVKFVNSKSTQKEWVDELLAPPYSLNIKINDDYVLFSYNMVESNFSLPIVQEARGIILRRIDGSKDYKVVCQAFNKFFNYGEGHAAKIDWNSARVLEKLDGSLMKVWYDCGWHISTNNCIDARDALLDQANGISFYAYFMEAWNNQGGNFDRLNKNYCYMFELCGPLNRVVVPYKEVFLYHIGTRDMTTLKEVAAMIEGFPWAPHHRLSNLDECVASAAKLGFNKEGYVVVDKNYNRVKIKGPAWLSASYLKNNGVLTVERILDQIRSGESEEFLAYFPEYKEEFEKVETVLYEFEQSIYAQRRSLRERKSEEWSQKDFALTVSELLAAPYFFEWRKTGRSLADWIEKMQSWRLANYLEKFKCQMPLI